jgi:hypothetical protein
VRDSSSPCLLILLLEKPFNPLNAELNPIRHLMVLLRAHPILYISRIRVNISSHLHIGLLIKTLYAPLLSPMLVTCPAHHIFLDLSTRVFDVEYRSSSSALCRVFSTPLLSFQH